jgi:hypothetical protein
MPKCMICGQEFKERISGMHLRKHEINMEAYKKMFPNAITISKEGSKKISDSTKEQIKRDGHWAKGKTKENSESVKNIVETRKKNNTNWFPDDYIHWSKTKDQDEVRAIFGTVGKKGAKTKKERGSLLGEKNGMYGKSVYDVWVKKYGKEEADRRALARNKKLSEKSKGSNNPMYGKPAPQGSGVGKYTKYKDINFRSTWEAKVAEWLDENNITWKYEEKRYKLSNGTTYLPDFFIYEGKKLTEVVEVKGYMDDISKTKIDLFSHEYPHISLKIFDETMVKKLGLL